MAHHLSSLRRGAVSAACVSALAAAGPATAQVSPTVTVTARPAPLFSVGGFADPPATLPMHSLVLSAEQLRDAGVGSLSGLSALDAAISDAYNSPGYWSQLTARGFVLDNRGNYRRDGLPINAETAIPLGNKERVEVLLGTSGIQAGTSAPGGLVNLVVKRPGAALREAVVEVRERGSVAWHADLAERFGAERQWGVRINAAAAELRPHWRDANGRSHLAAAAVEWLVSPTTRLEFEIEASHQQQRSLPGFSLLGAQLPDARKIDPRTNLNNQPWSLPVVLDGTTTSLRWQRRLAGGWAATAHAATQRLRSDDRVAFPFGCYDSAADTYYTDRYCPDGSFDLYDFRSENERRRVDALDLHLDGALQTASLSHRFTAGVLLSRDRDRFGRQAYNHVGSGSIAGTVVTAPAPELTDENTNRDERSREVYLRDRVSLGERWLAWLGLRHTRVERQSVRTDGSRPTDYAQSFSTPWLALSYQPRSDTTWYVSWGEGSESEVVPNRSRYRNRGLALPAMKSRQWEAGVKGGSALRSFSVVWFDIRRPVAQDFCNADETLCDRETDGIARHRGIDASAQASSGPWSLGAGVQWLAAKREGSRVAESNGREPVNVPERSARVQLSYRIAPAATLQASIVHEGRRSVLPDNSIRLPSWSRLDLAAQWPMAFAGKVWQWRAGVDNITDHRAWRESPYQFGHSYLYPLAPRSWRLSLATRF